MSDELTRRVRDALGPGRTSQTPPEELWSRIAAGTSLLPRRRFLDLRFATTGLAAAALLVAVGIFVRRRSVESPAPHAVQVVTIASLESIDAALSALRRDSASVPRVADEMLFLARMRASLQSDFPQRSP
ncbi:MAG TPA: hypothetical protein VGQ52_22300 [Gemmatimonadaceae bacterium]|nr:hypothetical protein [Gemmatimonadaceae bacterium]